jgi:enoyl-CoA hydratase
VVNRVVEIEAYLDEAVKLAGELAERAPLAVQAAKKMINEAYERSLSDGLYEERREFYNLFATEDQKEGMRAFIEKREPQWKGK